MMTVSLASAACPPSFETLYTTYYQPIYQFVLQLLGSGSREQAEDVTQETFLKAYRAFPRLTSVDRLHNWLYTIARRTAYDVLRGRVRKPACSLDVEEHEEQAGYGPDLEEEYEARETMAEAWARLSPVQQWACSLALQGYQPTEIAHCMAISPVQCRRLLQRARATVARQRGGEHATLPHSL